MAKRRHKKKALSVRVGEGATVERCQHIGGVTKEIVDRDASGKVYIWRYRVRCECMLDVYLLRELLAEREHQAGMEYRKASLRVHHGVKVKDEFHQGRFVSYEDSLLIVPESERFLRMADKQLTSAQRKIIIRVCCDDKLAGGTDSLETLRRGLSNLADHLGIR